VQQQYTYEGLLQTAHRVNWRVDDIVGGDKSLDFSKPFLPESFARTEPLQFLSPGEKLLVNHVRAHCYLAMFELVETFIVPFVNGQADTDDDRDEFRAPALKHFAGEEAKHMELFRRFRREFAEGFGVECAVIGPAGDIARAVLDHGDLSIAVLLLGLEWMSQAHYVESVKDNRDLDPQFKSLLKHHWIEEAQHAKLDVLMMQSMVRRYTAEERERALDEYFEIGAFFDAGFKQQAMLDLEAFERAAGRSLSDTERAPFIEVQHQALRWTFLGSHMINPHFLSTLASLGGDARDRVERAAPALC